MQLSLHSDFALRVLMTLAAHDELVTIDWLADRHGISRNHLAKVAQTLSSFGWIETVRGRGGGIRLARSPDMIRVGDVIRRCEQLDSFVSCMGTNSNCRIDGACGLKPALRGALDAFLNHLDRFTLTDITRQERELLRRLHA